MGGSWMDMVEDFWGLHSFIGTPGQIPRGSAKNILFLQSNYSFVMHFRAKIKKMTKPIASGDFYFLVRLQTDGALS